MKVIFVRRGWLDYTSHTERRLVRRINQLIADIQRNGYDGIGKPEPLRGDLSGWHSRRIDQEHRLVYRIVGTGDDRAVEIIACRTHYPQ